MKAKAVNGEENKFHIDSLRQKVKNTREQKDEQEKTFDVDKL